MLNARTCGPFVWPWGNGAKQGPVHKVILFVFVLAAERRAHGTSCIRVFERRTCTVCFPLVVCLIIIIVAGRQSEIAVARQRTHKDDSNRQRIVNVCNARLNSLQNIWIYAWENWIAKWECGNYLWFPNAATPPPAYCLEKAHWLIIVCIF